MNLENYKLEAVDNALYTLLTAGLCDKCNVKLKLKMQF
jgi:hypothetical protein